MISLFAASFERWMISMLQQLKCAICKFRQIQSSIRSEIMKLNSVTSGC